MREIAYLNVIFYFIQYFDHNTYFSAFYNIAKMRKFAYFNVVLYSI